MNDKFIPPPNQIRPIQPRPIPKDEKAKKPSGTSFQELLDQETGKLQFSKHAQQRLQARRIQVSEKDLEKLHEAVDMAASKGAKESLVMVGDVAYVVSVKNNMVITALDGQNARNNVYTNIDSAVIMD